ncbi:MAG: cysteine hydrolase [Comamonas sp.]
MHSNQLLIIDPQNDFCDTPDSWWPRSPLDGSTITPALPAPGAHADMQRLARWITEQGNRLSNITITLDSHQAYDIAHPGFWRQRDGSAVNPFTPITAAQVRSGNFVPRNAIALPRVLQYLDALEAEGRYTLMVWPLHCEIGSWGHGVHAAVLAACRDWQATQHRAVHHVFKGMNPFTEHYSAIRAEVPDPQDPETGLNEALLQHLTSADQLLIAGEAGSHCVRATTEHIVQNIGRYAVGYDLSRIVLLTDCMSPVSGFADAQTAFVAQMRAAGVRCETSTGFTL